MCPIEGPGKFEGETCITVLAHTWLLDGMADDDDAADPGDCGRARFDGPFTSDPSLCTACTSALLAANAVYYSEDGNGFAHSELE